MNANELNIQWELRGISFVFLFLCSSVFVWGHLPSNLGKLEFFLTTGVTGAHPSEVFGGLIMLQKHLEHESLVHYESGSLPGIIPYHCFLVPPQPPLTHFVKAPAVLEGYLLFNVWQHCTVHSYLRKTRQLQCVHCLCKYLFVFKLNGQKLDLIH